MNKAFDKMSQAISTHAPRTGSDCSWLFSFYNLSNFNPRSPHGERLALSTASRVRLIFQPTLPARGATWRRRTLLM